MYLPQAFEENRIEVLHAMMRGNPLMTLVTGGAGALQADHVPVEIDVTPAPLGVVRGHVARANPLWRRAAATDAVDARSEVLAIFQGPQTYISPSLYPSKEASGKVVPTWDYAVVHAYGVLRFVHDPAWLLALVERLTNAHEATRSAPWRVGDAPSDYIGAMLSAIVGFELQMTRVIGKWKISQNRSRVDRAGVVAGLSAAGDADAREVAQLLAARGDGVDGGERA